MRISLVGPGVPEAATAPPAIATLTIAAPDLAHLPSVHVPENHAIDRALFGGGSVLLAGRLQPLTFSKSSALEIEGWAVDARAKAPSSTVFALVAGKPIVATMGTARSDVAAALGIAAYASAGFSLVFPPGALPRGRSSVVLRAVTADGSGAYALTPPISVFVTP